MIAVYLHLQSQTDDGISTNSLMSFLEITKCLFSTENVIIICMVIVVVKFITWGNNNSNKIFSHTSIFKTYCHNYYPRGSTVPNTMY